MYLIASSIILDAKLKCELLVILDLFVFDNENDLFI